MARVQPVHVGETVRFSFVLKDPLRQKALNATGRADYCVFAIGGERIESDVERSGKFTGEYTFVNVSPGDSIIVRASAYRQRGPRDHVKVDSHDLDAEGREVTHSGTTELPRVECKSLQDSTVRREVSERGTSRHNGSRKWRRGESNPRPATDRQEFLRA